MMHRRVGDDSQHMFPLDLNSSRTTSSSSSSSSPNGYAPTVAYANDCNSGSSSSRGPSPPPAPRRRSHRPRGCRGGRKNRKNKQAGSGGAPSQQRGFSTLSSYGSNTANSNTGILPDAPFSQRQNQHFPRLSKGNVSSAYQHVRTETQSWSTKTSFMAESSARNSNISLHKNHDINNKSSASPKKPGLQVLPPALPPFVAGKDPFLQGGGPDNSGDLKMLPSFEESVTSESFIPPPSQGTAVAPTFSPTKQQPRAEGSFHHSYSNNYSHNYSRSSSSNNYYYSAPAAMALSSTTASVSDLLPSTIGNLLLDVSSNHAGSISGSSSSDKSLEDYHGSSSDDDHHRHGGSSFPMDSSSVASLSSTSASEEDDRDIHEILFGEGAGVISSLFDTSPRSFLTNGGESKFSAWK